MRLTTLQTKAICETAQACFGLDVRVWLFGSRVDDLAKGGDIDLYIESQMDNAADLITRHADRLNWAMAQLQPHWPFSAATISQLSDMDLAILDQFATRFGKLQDVMGAKLFPAVLERGDLNAFIDNLYRLEKIGAIASADNWLLMREISNAFSHDYTDDSPLQAEVLNKAFQLAVQLLDVLNNMMAFIAPYRKKQHGSLDGV